VAVTASLMLSQAANFARKTRLGALAMQVKSSHRRLRGFHRRRCIRVRAASQAGPIHSEARA